MAAEAKRIKIDPARVVAAVMDQVSVIAAHLDFEGLAYIKITRDGAQSCFASDVTSRQIGNGATIVVTSAEKWGKLS